MSKIEEQVINQGIEHLDFEMPCGLREQWWLRFFGYVIKFPQSRRCKHPVAWKATLPCCGSFFLCCAKHRRDATLGLPHCGIRWQHINLTWSKI